MHTSTAGSRRGRLLPTHDVLARTRNRQVRSWGRRARRRLDTSADLRRRAARSERLSLEAVISVQRVRRLADASSAAKTISRYFGGERVDVDAIVVALVELSHRDTDSAARRALICLANAVATWRELDDARARDLIAVMTDAGLYWDDSGDDELTGREGIAGARLTAASPPTGVLVKAVAPANAPNLLARAHPSVMSGGACARSCLRSRH